MYPDVLTGISALVICNKVFIVSIIFVCLPDLTVSTEEHEISLFLFILIVLFIEYT